jgi:hypothetical protein
LDPSPPPLPLEAVYTEPCAWVFGGELLGRLTGGQVCDCGRMYTCV